MITDIVVIQVGIEEIKPYSRNTKQHPEDQIDLIASSIKEYGFNVPILIDQKKEIICGHGRYFAAKKIGLKKIPCVMKKNLTPSQIKAFRIADNKIAESEWDMSFLMTEINDLKFENFDLSLTGFSEIEISNLFSFSSSLDFSEERQKNLTNYENSQDEDEDEDENEQIDLGSNYSDCNKEININALDGQMIIKLKYTENEYWIVKKQLDKIANTPEQAVWRLLGNE